MKTITLSYTLQTNGKKLAVSLAALFRAVGLDGEVTAAEIPGEVLDTLRVRLVSPGTSGAVELSQDANKPCYYTLDGSNLLLTLSNLVGGVHRLTVLVKYGTNTRALLLVDLSVPQNIQFLKSGGAVLMPLIRKPELDTTLEGVKWYGYAYLYGEKIAWLQTDKPLHVRGTIPALYAESLETGIGDATAITASVVQNAGVTTFDTVNDEPVELGAVDTFGSPGGATPTDKEHVNVLLTLPEGAEPIDWTQYHVDVEYLSQGKGESLQLDANGRCDFYVPVGEQYLVAFPHLDGYAEPIAEHFTAVGGEKQIHFAYRTDARVERIIVYAKNDASGDISALIGQTVTLTTDGTYETSAEFGSDYKAILEVPYGENYAVHVPTIDGWHPHKSTFTGTADRPERYYIAHYIPAGAGAFGIDANGTYYSEEEITALEDKTIIKYIGYTDSVLEAADRGDGTIGCGFMFAIPVSTVDRSWATQNVQFDPALLPNLNDSQAASDYKSLHNTELMRDIAEDLGISSPAADYCLSIQETVGDKQMQCILPAAGIWQKIMDNWKVINAISQAAGRGTLPFKALSWCSSSQYSADGAWYLANGSLTGDGNKGSALKVARFFDLYV